MRLYAGQAASFLLRAASWTLRSISCFRWFGVEPSTGMSTPIYRCGRSSLGVSDSSSRICAAGTGEWVPWSLVVLKAEGEKEEWGKQDYHRRWNVWYRFFLVGSKDGWGKWWTIVDNLHCSTLVSGQLLTRITLMSREKQMNAMHQKTYEN